MKKTTLTLFCLFITTVFYAQTYSTGVVNFTENYSGKVDVTNTTVTLTLIGPSTGYLALAFNATQMDDIGADVVIFDGTNMSDRTFDGQGVVPPLDATQNWTISSNNVVAGTRTVVATRARNTGDSNDYAFSTSAQPLNLVWALKPTNFAISYHGNGNCGATTANFSLGINDFDKESIKLYPNPAKNYTSIHLPNIMASAEVKIYDSLGRVVKNKTISTEDNQMDTSDLTVGTYMVVIRTEYGNVTKSLIIE
jgi:hypothetical protein